MWLFDHFSYIFATFFLTLGLVRILWKNKREAYTEKMCQKIPQEDEKIIDLIKKIDKSILFFAYPAIILGLSILIAEFVFHSFDNGDLRKIPLIILMIGLTLNCSPSYYGAKYSMGMLWMLRHDIFDTYEEQKFNPVSEWRDDWGLEKLGLVEKKDNQEYVKEKVKIYYWNFYSIFIGKIICYIGAFCIIIFY